MSLSVYERSIGVLRWLYDGQIATPAVLEPAVFFPSSGRFQAAWRTCREEALGVQQTLADVPLFHELMPQQRSISAHDQRDWRMFVLKAYGVDLPANARRCPTLAALVASSPEVVSAALSFMAPGKQVPEHRGPFRGIVRYYLGLSVPCAADGLPGTILTIDGCAHRLGEGDALLWDDTYPHQIWNNSGGVRIALLLDVRRPGLAPPLRWLSAGLIALAGGVIRLRGRTSVHL